jgi:hypothetical protein
MSESVDLERRLRALEAKLEALASRERGTGTGTVTSVGLTMPAPVFDVANSPVTGSGTLAVTFDTQSANTVFAGPSSGGAATPTFRALVMADLGTTGTFTPTYFGQTTAGTTTYVAQSGAYTRVGNAIFFTLYVSWSNATGTGNALVGGLPFTAANVAAQVYSTAIWYYGITYAAGTGVQTVIQPNTDRVQLWNSPASSTGSAQLAVEAAGELLMTGVYFV